jgi:hypothetical protein
MAGHRWLTPAILATQEAGNRRRMLQKSQSGQIVHKTLSQNNPAQKTGLAKRSQVAESLSSNPGNAKKKKEKESLGPLIVCSYFQVCSFQMLLLVE